MGDEQLNWLKRTAEESRDFGVASAQKNARFLTYAAGVFTALSIASFSYGDDLVSAFGYSKEVADTTAWLGAGVFVLLVFLAVQDVFKSRARAQSIASSELVY